MHYPPAGETIAFKEKSSASPIRDTEIRAALNQPKRYAIWKMIQIRLIGKNRTPDLRDAVLNKIALADAISPGLSDAVDQSSRAGSVTRAKPTNNIRIRNIITKGRLDWINFAHGAEMKSGFIKSMPFLFGMPTEKQNIDPEKEKAA